MTRTTEQRWAANTLCTPSMGHGRKGGHSGSQELLYDGTTSALMFIGGDRSSEHREEVVRRGRRFPASAGAGRLGKLVGSPPPGRPGERTESHRKRAGKGGQPGATDDFPWLNGVFYLKK